MSRNVHVVKSETKASVAKASKETPADARDLLDQAKVILVRGDAVTVDEKRAVGTFVGVSDQAMSLIADTFTRYRSLFGETDFDPASVETAVAYEREHAPIEVQARALADRLRDQVFMEKAGAAKSCLQIYQTMKTVSRTKAGADLRPLVKEISALVKPVRRSKKAVAPKPEPAPASPAVTEVKSSS